MIPTNTFKPFLKYKGTDVFFGWFGIVNNNVYFCYDLYVTSPSQNLGGLGEVIYAYSFLIIGEILLL